MVLKRKVIKKKAKYSDIKSSNSFGKSMRNLYKSELNHLLKDDIEKLEEYILPIKGSSTYTYWDCKAYKAKVY